MRKRITIAVLASVLVAAPVLAASTTPAPEGAAAPAKPAKSTKKTSHHVHHGASKGTKHSTGENTTGTAK